jgi:hypothetical protein
MAEETNFEAQAIMLSIGLSASSKFMSSSLPLSLAHLMLATDIEVEVGINPRPYTGHKLTLSGLILHQLVEVLQLTSDKIQVPTAVRISQHGS